MAADGMKDSFIVRMRKLAIWHTRTFKPILTHHELEPIMATLGFVAVPTLITPINDGGAASSANPTPWKEYFYPAAGGANCRRWSAAELPQPRPRLPYPRIDGLHIQTYRAFLDAVNFYLGISDDISNFFHIRGMPLHRVQDGNKWQRMEEDDSSVFVYREGTLDLATLNFYNANKNDLNSSSSRNKACFNTMIFRGRENNVSSAGSKFVPLKDIIVENSSCSKSKTCNNMPPSF